MRSELLLVGLLFAQVAFGADKQVENNNAASRAAYERGELAYDSLCRLCHDRGINGAPMLGDPSEWSRSGLDWRELLKRHATHGFISMPSVPQPGRASPRALRDAASYMADVIEAAQLFQAPVRQSMQESGVGVESGNVEVDSSRALEKYHEGERVFAAYCARCHQDGVNGAPRIRVPADWTGERQSWRTLLAKHAAQGAMSMPPIPLSQPASPEAVEAAVDYMADVISAFKFLEMSERLAK